MSSHARRKTGFWKGLSTGKRILFGGLALLGLSVIANTALGTNRDGTSRDYLSAEELILLLSGNRIFCAGYDPDTKTCGSVTKTRTINNHTVESALVYLNEDGSRKFLIRYSGAIVGNAACIDMNKLLNNEALVYEALDTTPQIDPSQPVIDRVSLSREAIEEGFAKRANIKNLTLSTEDRICDRYIGNYGRSTGNSLFSRVLKNYESVLAITYLNGRPIDPIENETDYLLSPDAVTLRP
jgi:hypothetical protein